MYHRHDIRDHTSTGFKTSVVERCGIFKKGFFGWGGVIRFKAEKKGRERADVLEKRKMNIQSYY
jgi:hypothetical protein